MLHGCLLFLVGSEAKMSASPCLKVKWLEHLNGSWVAESCESLVHRHAISELFERLVLMQEVVVTPQEVLHLKAPLLPDFDCEPDLTQQEHEHYLNLLLSNQISLGRAVCSDSPFSSLLQKQLTVLQRIFYAISTKYHERRSVGPGQSLKEGGLVESRGPPESGPVTGSSATDALIEMGVRTGLSLIFSLLRQNWSSSSQAGPPSLCNDVLQTALNVVQALPPLSLANESKLPPLGLTSLKEVSAFLKSVSLPPSGVDEVGRRLCSELLLLLAVQRGSLSHLLNWIDMAMCASASRDGCSIGARIFTDVIQQMKKRSMDGVRLVVPLRGFAILFIIVINGFYP